VINGGPKSGVQPNDTLPPEGQHDLDETGLDSQHPAPADVDLAPPPGTDLDEGSSGSLAPDDPFLAVRDVDDAATVSITDPSLFVFDDSGGAPTVRPDSPDSLSWQASNPDEIPTVHGVQIALPFEPGQVTSPEIRRFWREECDRRFGRELLDYVQEKYEIDPFAVEGNKRLYEYATAFLEFLFKKWFKAHVLSRPEYRAYKALIYGADGKATNSVRNYFDDKFSRLSSIHHVRAEHTPQSDLHHDEAEDSEELPREITSEVDRVRGEISRRGDLEMELAPLKDLIEQEHRRFFENIPEFRFMDVGPAIGAISALFILKALDEYGLLNNGRVKIWLADVSPNVIQANLAGNFDVPDGIAEDLFGSRANYERYKQYLITHASGLVCAADEEIPLPNGFLNLTVDGFFLHHVPGADCKGSAVGEMVRVTDGAILTADESPVVYARGGIKERHAASGADHKSRLTPEQPITLDQSIELYGPVSGRICFRNHDYTPSRFGNNEYYAYWCVTKPDPSTSNATAMDGYGDYFMPGGRGMPKQPAGLTTEESTPHQ